MRAEKGSFYMNIKNKKACFIYLIYLFLFLGGILCIINMQTKKTKDVLTFNGRDFINN